MKFLLRLISKCPLTVARFIGALIGWLCWLFRTREAKVTATNIALCFPALSNQERAARCRQSMVEWGKSLLEIPAVWGHDADWLFSKIKSVNNIEAYQQAKSADEGLIVIAPHIGNWEVVGLYCSSDAQLTSMFAPSGRD
ncbi:MAG: lysophospholipid acyltransferase family protein, partial [bacterium]